MRGFAPSGLPNQLTPVDANVIHKHGLREYSRRVGIAGPTASDGNVQQDEEWMVVDPLRAFGQIGGSTSGIEVIIGVETDRFRLPLDGVEMKVCLLYTSDAADE